MTNPASLGVAVPVALILVLAAPASGLAQFRTTDHGSERTNVPPRPPMRAYRPAVPAPPAAVPPRNAAPPAAAENRPSDHDRDRGDFAAGVAAGVVLGGAVATPGIYNVPAPSPVDDPVAYCTWMYSSYDPQSGTYIGDDGKEHPCP